MKDIKSKKIIDEFFRAEKKRIKAEKQLRQKRQQRKLKQKKDKKRR